MSSSPTLLDPADRTRQRDEDAQYYRGILHELVEMATDIARAVHRQAAPKPAAEQSADPTPESTAPAPNPSPQQAIAFDRIARTIRRTIALARKLSEPDRAPPGPKEHCAEGCDECCPSARQRRTDSAETDALHAEPCDRPEQPDFDADEDLGDDLDEQSLADLIASLRHDTGFATLTDAQLRQRRTPQTAQESTPEGTPGQTCGLCAHREAIPRREHPRSGCKADQPRTASPRTTQPRTGDPPPLPAPDPRSGTGPPAP